MRHGVGAWKVMWKNHLTVAWRNLSRNRMFSIINLIGLAIGLCCFVLIALYVWNETSYDKYNLRAADIYRINSDFRWGGQDIHQAESSDMTGALLQKDYPEVEEYTRVYNQFTRKMVEYGAANTSPKSGSPMSILLFSAFSPFPRSTEIRVRL